MENTQLLLRPIDWNESWLVRDLSACSLSLCVRTRRFIQWAEQSGTRVHALPFADAAGETIYSLPPEFVGRLVAPFYARAFNSLVPLSNWYVLVETLMHSLSYDRALSRMHSVKVWAQEPPPSERGLYEVARHALARVLPHLWGDATEIYLMPAIPEGKDKLLRVFHRRASISEARDFVKQLPAWVGIFRDSTAIEIVSSYTTDELRKRMRLEAVNRAWQRRAAEITAWLASLYEAQPAFESIVFEQADAFWQSSRNEWVRAIRKAIASAKREIVGGYPVRRGVFDLLLRYEFVRGGRKIIQWLLARGRVGCSGLSVRRFCSLGSWTYGAVG